ncbi:unnamed protein product [Rotaria sordida]|uniref:EF-hand domain-containing protein n=1 Tax=Rotaria sordida TaxID=392033 RepID=A0A814JTC8_9BILA|nr:unnamed protein product [Rotaria sordida]CAF1041770.1 unnamed protein product [Rotaria sordida]CAF3573627.1 unnamed protein product [Rotaria sordida]CAF3870996.1 unnamed protein product [Rotaria sordida]
MGNNFKLKKRTAQVAPQQAVVYLYPQQQAVRYNPALGQWQQQVTYGGASISPINTSQPIYENDSFLSNLTGWSVEDIKRLREEFINYTNQYGLVDRDGFRRLFVASLLNTTWQGLELNTEAVFRYFDLNQSGALDFNEYIMACLRMTNGM